MNFVKDEFYHVYNRGNNRQKIFFNDENYLFFLKKIREQLLPYSDMIAYCLMPNHFHFLLRPSEKGLGERESYGGKPMQELAYRTGILLSSYAQAINNQNKTTGSLFQQKTKAKVLYETDNDARISYFEKCFHYIHQNPAVAGIVVNSADWPYSSYTDYIGLRNGTLYRAEIFYSLTGLKADDIKAKTMEQIDEIIVDKLF
ncbi:MAG: transposase [Sphingobacteriales bacterium]|nr:transposase [Sphingobacteriales bacterium]